MTSAKPPMRIGEVAEKLGITTRTLRYYEEVGLVKPSEYSAGGARRYSDEDFDRVAHVRELQSVMGFNLDEIRALLQDTDRISELRAEYYAGVTDERTTELVREAMRVNAHTQAQVHGKMQVLQNYLDQLKDEARRRTEFAAEHNIKLD